MKFARVAVAIGGVCASQLCWAQGPGEHEPSKANTKLEQFQARTGVVIVRGFTKVGSVQGQTGEVEVDARELRDAGNLKVRQTGVALHVKQEGRLGRSNISYVDYDEIDSLVQGIDYILKVKPDITSHKDFEIDYRTRGDLQVTIFTSSRGGLSAAVTSGNIGRARVFLNVSDLEKLRALIVDAKSKL